jgi:hypothetical protein
MVRVWTVIAVILLPIFSAVLGYNFYEHARQDAKIEALKDNYVRRDDFGEFKKELWKRLDKIEEELKKR